MRVSGTVGMLVLLFMTACAGIGSNQEKELVENGFTAMSGGDYRTAEHLLNQALVINDKNPYALLNLGVIYQETKRFEEARKAYQSVIDLKPKETAAASNVKGYTGIKLADIARTNLQSLPTTPGGREVESSADADQDGVSNDLDKCLKTPAQAAVSPNGCWTLMGIFPTGKTTIGLDAYEQLDQAVVVLEQNPSLRIEIQGHTDNMGADDKNLRLSEQRAQSVREYLIDKGVDPDRLQWAGYGHTQPMSTNTTAKGREQNRRVELNPISY